MARFTLVISDEDLAFIDKAAGPTRRREFMIAAALGAASQKLGSPPPPKQVGGFKRPASRADAEPR